MQELIHRMKEIAANQDLMASFAIMHVTEFMEPEEVVAVLEDLRDDAEVPGTIRNLVKMKLDEVYSWSDESEKALDVLKSIVKPQH